MRKNKKDNGLRAVICLAVATVAVGVASIAASKMDTSVPVTQQPTDQTQQAGQTGQPGTSQNQQTAQILADNAAQTVALENYLDPPVRPCYVVPNPNGCNCGTYNYGCGCGA